MLHVFRSIIWGCQPQLQQGKECLRYPNNTLGKVLCKFKGRNVYFFHYAVRWQVSGIHSDSELEFGQESGTRCCQGILQMSGLFCSPKVICLLIIAPFFLNQPCEICALRLHASSQSYLLLLLLLCGPWCAVTYYRCDDIWLLWR